MATYGRDYKACRSLQTQEAKVPARQEDYSGKKKKKKKNTTSPSVHTEEKEVRQERLGVGEVGLPDQPALTVSLGC